jgi:hypothetical protein
LISSIRRRVSSPCVQAGPVTSTPALLTQRSSEPSLATSAASARQAASSRTSSAADRVPLPISAAVWAGRIGVDDIA